MIRSLFELDDQIIDIALDIFTEHIIKNYLYCPLASYSYIIKCEGHDRIGKSAFRYAASTGLLIFWHQLNLIVSCVQSMNDNSSCPVVQSNMSFVIGSRKLSFEQASLRSQKST